MSAEPSRPTPRLNRAANVKNLAAVTARMVAIQQAAKAAGKASGAIGRGAPTPPPVPGVPPLTTTARPGK